MTAAERVVRPSSLSDAADCMRRFAARHLREEVLAAGYDLRPRPPSHVGALVGGGTHGGVAYSLDHLRTDGTPGQQADAEEQAIAVFRERMEAEGAVWDDVTERPNTAERQVRRMVRSYRLDILPSVQPLEVERRIEAEFLPGWVVSGQADTLAEDATDPLRQVIRDVKTGTRRRAGSLQYGAYAMLFEAHGRRPGSIVEDFIPRVALAKEQPPAESHAIDLPTARQDAWALLQAIARATDDFASRLADPHGADPRAAFLANPNSGLCSDRWCPAWGTRFCTSHRR